MKNHLYCNFLHDVLLNAFDRTNPKQANLKKHQEMVKESFNSIGFLILAKIKLVIDGAPITVINKKIDLINFFC
jgi:hypothetical protein